MAGRATHWLFWRCVLVATILLSTAVGGSPWWKRAPNSDSPNIRAS